MAATLTEDEACDDLGVLRELAGYHLRRASGTFAADFAHVLGGTGIRQVLFGILSVVAANPGINQGAVGRTLGIKRANMVALINELVAMAMIDRRVASGDRRAFALTLTETGDQTLADCLELIRSHEARMLSGLTVHERDVLIALLGRIEANGRRSQREAPEPGGAAAASILSPPQPSSTSISASSATAPRPSG